MKNKMTLLYIGLVVLLIVTGVVVYKAVFAPKLQLPVVKEEKEQVKPTPVVADSNLVVTAKWSKAASNTVVLSVSNLNSKYQNVAYELTYDSQGLIKGVNSGSKPIDVIGKDSFQREIYLGTCSRNVCKPDLGIKQVSVVLEFTDSLGQKSQFSKDFDL
ncbi:hypothetical protein KKB64_05460 [Patescibacteria group bacterium]|nr:hypothetical protein [Patescibacteria group bacterium]MBU1473198.1 hypothetical protein [Patescibacteria group bacterium]MBU2544739.1 hypothetical protein [Patescibacteria group bacterium]